MTKKEKGKKANDGVRQYVEKEMEQIQFIVGSYRWCQRGAVLYHRKYGNKGWDFFFMSKTWWSIISKYDEKQKEMLLSSEFNLEKVKSFCYFGDTIETSGGAELALRSKIKSAWNKETTRWYHEAWKHSIIDKSSSL